MYTKNSAPNRFVVAIDGPAGAGKSTVARRLAALLGCLYIDTGAMYRAVTLKALRQGVPLDEESLARLVRGTTIELVPLSLQEEAGVDPQATCRVLLDRRDVTGEIRSPAVTRAVSTVSSFAAVRERLVEQQRRIAEQVGRVVMDGRDIGTVVLPDADVKFFLTASIPERARRRRQELSAKGIELSQSEMEEAITLRDRLDSSRVVAPLRAAPDAVVIDSTGKTIEEVVQLMLAYCQEGGRP